MNNLVESIQKNLGYAAISKIDPNIQDIKEKTVGANSIGQAAIPAVLFGVFNYILLPGADYIPLFRENSKWLNLLFGDHHEEVVNRIAAYAGTSPANARVDSEHIAAEAVRLIKSNVLINDDPDKLRKFALENKNDVLKYLPAALQIGQLLANDDLDDRTHKMEGPISSMMHSFEKKFSGDSSQ